jgi:galactose oxidase-like protein
MRRPRPAATTLGTPGSERGRMANAHWVPPRSPSGRAVVPGVALVGLLVASALLASPSPARAFPPLVSLDPAGTHPAATSAASAVGVWTNLTGGLPKAPGPRFGGAQAWDSVDGQAVIFGGIDVGGGALRTTWTYASESWHLAGPVVPNATNEPSSRFGAAMSNDPSTGAVVLFGGRGTVGGLLNDTWTFLGGTWTNITSRVIGAPPARVNASLTFDPSLGSVVLFGGRSPGTLFSDTWAFNGTAWTYVGAAIPSVTNTPPHRYGATLVYSAVLSALVLFGGMGYASSTYAPLSDTWAFGGSGWQQLHPTSSPAPRTFAAGAPLPNGDDLLFGGLGVRNVVSDTWRFDGSVWTDETGVAGTPPSARYGSFAIPVSLVNNTGYVLLFGGSTNGTVLADTWAVGANAIVSTRGAASPPALDVGQTTVLTVVAFGPTAPITYSWSGLPTGCRSSTAANVSCVPSAAGRYAPVVNISDGPSGSLRVPISFLVNSLPTISAVRVTPFPLVVGTGNVTLAVQASGGTGGLRFSYAGLPPGCATNDTAFLICAPLKVGSWTVAVTARDATNATASSNATVVVAATGPAGPNHLLARILSPLGITLILVGLGVVVLLVYSLRRRGRRAAQRAGGTEGVEGPTGPNAPGH